ncbi:MAG: hypothetical protein WDW38_009177 [Sanguina aurantia]
MSCFLHAMRPAIQHITRLELDSGAMYSSSDCLGQLLSLLAPACPALQQLTVTGDLGRRMLVAFGKNCSKLSSLEVTDVSCSTLHQLHLIMPSLTHCRVPALPGTRPCDNTPPKCCLSLLSCTTLTHVDIGAGALTAKLWRALPLGLRELRCHLARKPPAGLKALPRLQTLHLECDRLGRVDVCDVVAVLRISPQLGKVQLWPGVIHEPCNWSYSISTPHLCLPSPPSHPGTRIPDLIHLNERVLAGLAVSSSSCRGDILFEGVVVSLLDDELGDDERGTDGLVASLPPLTAFTCLILEEFRERGELSTVTKGLAAAFPNLETLVIDQSLQLSEAGGVVYMENSDLRGFAGLKLLQQLSLRCVHVEPMQLAMLCSRSASLASLWLRECTGFDDDGDAAALQELLRDWGSDVVVVADL